MPSITELYDLARRYHQSGDLQQAEPLYRQIVQANPNYGEAHNNLGGVLYGQGKLAEAIECFRQALLLNPTLAEVHFNLGNALKDCGQAAEAALCYRRALRIKPNYPDAHNNLGNVLKEQGQLVEATECYRQAVRINPHFAEAYNNLGIVLKEQGQPAEAVLSYRQALRINPNHADVHYNLAIVLDKQRQFAEAAECYRQALRINPNHADAYFNLGNALNQQGGQFAEVIECYRQALRLDPKHAEVHNNLGIALAQQGRPDEAIGSYQQALQLDPNYAQAHNNLGNVLKNQGRLDEAIACFQTALRLDPRDQTPQDNLLLTLLYHPRYDARAIFDEHQRWAQGVSPSPLESRHTNDPSPERRLRIGYVSPDFRAHVVGRNVWPLLSEHDHRQFEITLYANHPKADALTEQFRGLADHWRDIAGKPDDQVAHQIRQDGIDILVDLALHTDGNRLPVFARKPAPVQVTFAGYPGTTGLKAIDYRLTDPYLDPPGLFDNGYAEASYRLPHSFWCYCAQTEEPQVAPLPALEKGFVTFGCLNNFCKVNEDVLQLWAGLLHAVPEAQLLLLAGEGGHRQRTLDLLARLGIAAARAEFCPPKPRPEYLALYHQVDIGLDTFPYNGHSTSLDSYWMGVPVITLVGKTVVGRAGLSQLTNLGLQELAATSPEAFVGLAVDLAGDLPRLQGLRSGLRDRMRQSPLMDAIGFTRGIQQAYRSIWRNWCAKKV